MLTPITIEGHKVSLGEVDDKTYFRVGVAGDGNCMFHAWIGAMGKTPTRENASLLRHETIKLLKYDKDFQTSLLSGIREPEVYKQALQEDLNIHSLNNIPEILAYELQKERRFASCDILPSLANKCNVDLYLLSDNGSQLQPQHHRTTTGKRYSVILLNLGNYHYEYIVDSESRSPLHPSDPLIRRLYQLLLKNRQADNH